MTVHVHRDGPVAVVTLDRPEVRNAVDGPTAEALHAACVELDADDDVRVVVLTGARGTFCSGADLGALGRERSNRVAADGPGPMGPTRLEMVTPVVAAIEGYAVAGGLELALWADLRVAAEDAVLGVFCRRWGVPLVDGGTVRLPRLVGHSRAIDLILTGRAVDAEEAHAMGLVNRVCAPGAALATATALAHDLATLPQTCLRHDRLSARQQWALDEREALAVELVHGEVSLAAGALEGAARFVAGAGRHGGQA